jgi:hypothetical protein
MKNIFFVFTCKLRDAQHKAYEHNRDNTANGTSNLLCDKKACELRNNVDADGNPTELYDVVPYSESRHRAIIALRCSANKQSFNSVRDPLYLIECRFLRQDQSLRLPSPMTVQRDVQRLYVSMAETVTRYFEVSMNSC